MSPATFQQPAGPPVQVPGLVRRRVRQANAVLDDPVELCGRFSSLPAYLTFEGGVAQLLIDVVVVVVRKRQRARALAQGRVALPAFFWLALRPDGSLVVLGQSLLTGRAQAPVLHDLAPGTWTATVRKGGFTYRMDLSLAGGERLMTRAQVRGFGGGNKLVIKAIETARLRGAAHSAEDHAHAPTVTPGRPVAPAPDPVDAEALQVWDEHSLEPLLVELGFQDYVDQVLELARPSALLARVEGDTRERGTSRWGGWPDLSGVAVWPLTASREPLAFVLQLDLAEVAALGLDVALPAEGLLSVFADARGGEPVLVHTAADVELKRLRAPGVKAGTIAASLPTQGSYQVSALEPVASLVLPGDLAERIEVEDEDVVDLLDTVDGVGPMHRVGGYPRELTEPVAAQAAVQVSRPGATGKRAAKDFSFVLQLDTDPDAGLRLDGGGIAYVLADARGKAPADLVTVSQTG